MKSIIVKSLLYDNSTAISIYKLHIKNARCKYAYHMEYNGTEHFIPKNLIPIHSWEEIWAKTDVVKRTKMKKA